MTHKPLVTVIIHVVVIVKYAEINVLVRFSFGTQKYSYV
jgi:hypothetical protein